MWPQNPRTIPEEVMIMSVCRAAASEQMKRLSTQTGGVQRNWRRGWRRKRPKLKPSCWRWWGNPLECKDSTLIGWCLLSAAGVLRRWVTSLTQTWSLQKMFCSCANSTPSPPTKTWRSSFLALVPSKGSSWSSECVFELADLLKILSLLKPHHLFPSCSCEIIRDWKSGDSLCYAFIEFEKVSPLRSRMTVRLPLLNTVCNISISKSQKKSDISPLIIRKKVLSGFLFRFQELDWSQRHE